MEGDGRALAIAGQNRSAGQGAQLLLGAAGKAGQKRCGSSTIPARLRQQRPPVHADNQGMHVRQALRPGGQLIATIPNLAHFSSRWDCWWRPAPRVSLASVPAS